MSQPYDRIFNFSAGPCTLPVEVLEEAKEDLLNYKGTGMSVMEMSHRSKAYEGIIAAAEADLRTLMGVPDNYKVLFLQGGASTQFATIPMSYLPAGKTADFVLTGTWGKKALESAKIYGQTNVVFDAKADNYNQVPNLESLSYSSDAAFMHFTSNETIQGVEFKSDPSLSVPVICDMSSDILSRPVDVSKYALIYAGAQKNMGPAGVAVVIIRDDLLASGPDGLAPMFDYKVQAENGSMYNTPPCWSIYMCGLVYKHVLKHGGLAGAQARNQAKADVLYSAIDGSNGFFKGHAHTDCRSIMNVTFTLPDEDLTKTFIKETEVAGLDGLKGHRSVGGCRASIYNAFPQEGCEALAAAMKEFAAKHG
ncbi:MAG: phosphoserine transaminase [Armatimonadetes bacterium 55-13]|nr:3-phosphoserine/phosphohydroxythreonine transaminase [Armatimonadota bacterium]OJU64056.1 MAG: phosphoserine transaminase [Armatimonadetes bacterium 55-13]